MTEHQLPNQEPEDENQDQDLDETLNAQLENALAMPLELPLTELDLEVGNATDAAAYPEPELQLETVLQEEEDEDAEPQVQPIQSAPPIPPIPVTAEPIAPARPKRPVVKKPKPEADPSKPQENRVLRLLEKNPLGMTLPEMAGGPRQVKKIRLLRPQLADAIRNGQVMPVSQRAGNTVYRLVKYLAPADSQSLNRSPQSRRSFQAEAKPVL